jgi:hypothetical protein
MSTHATDDRGVALVRRLFTEVFQDRRLDVADEILSADFSHRAGRSSR